MPGVGVSEEDARNIAAYLYTLLTAYMLIISGGGHP